YQLRVMSKVAGFVRPPACSPVWRNVHLLVFTPERQRLLIPRRGPYKRLFPSKRAISACGHGSAMLERASQTLHEEFGLVAQPNRLIRLGEESSHPGYLESKEFWAITDSDGLLTAFPKMDLPSAHGLHMVRE